MKRRTKKSAEMSMWDHLKELRKVLLLSAYAVAFGTVGGWALSDMVYRLLAWPIAGLQGVNFITTTPMEPIFVKLKVSLVVGVVIGLPIVVWQLWSFILPALKNNEKKTVYFMAFWSLFLFLCGTAFSFLVVLPMGLKFLLFAGGGSVESIPFITKSSYLNFILTFLISFGLVFQLPIVLLLLIRLGHLTPKTLAKHRKWAFFIIVIVAVIISPTPDLITQLLMAGPMYMLYEMSIWLGYLVVRKANKRVTSETMVKEG
ncbi:MAG: twin-arginine translocase subunit TatC [Peptococcaceae bacterium]|nr:twin-arginine translocase subunit TatC [Peptococcaceae bacterium]